MVSRNRTGRAEQEEAQNSESPNNDTMTEEQHGYGTVEAQLKRLERKWVHRLNPPPESTLLINGVMDNNLPHK
jgi:hypothetical protein